MNEQSRDQIRSVWRKSWLISIQEFTSLEEQEALWLARKPGCMGSFVECMCGYFDDTFHGKSLDALCTDGFLSRQEADACREFHRLADSYEPPSGDEYDHQSILVDPKWHSVVSAAQRTWQHLRSILESTEERSFMESLDRA